MLLTTNRERMRITSTLDCTTLRSRKFTASSADSPSQHLCWTLLRIRTSKQYREVALSN